MVSKEQEQLIDFLVEVQKAANIKRKVHNIDSTELESVADHTYHMIWMAVLLLEDRVMPHRLLKIIKMILLHDLGEIEEGDIAFNKKPDNYKEVEEGNFKKVIKKLPPKLSEKFYELWLEFEENQSEEAKFAKAIDKLQPQIIFNDHFKKDSNYQMINDCTLDECEEMIFKYIEEVFPEYMYIVDRLKEHLKTK